MKLRTFILSAFAALAMSTACFAQDINVSLDGNIVDFPNQRPVIVEGRTLIPLRGVFDNMGYDIGWDGETKTVSLTKNSDTITIVIGESCYYLNGASHEIDVPAQIINGSTMLPMRAIADASGSEVLWDGETKIATIITPESQNITWVEANVTVESQEEMDFINSFTEINSAFNNEATAFMDYVSGVTALETEDDVIELANRASAVYEATVSAKNNLNALSCPAKYQKLKTTSVEYMQSIEDIAKLMVDLTTGQIELDEYETKLNSIGTELMLKEAEYRRVFAEAVNN